MSLAVLFAQRFLNHARVPSALLWRGARFTYVVLVLIIYIFVEVSAVLYLGALSAHALLGVDVMNTVVVLALVTGVTTLPRDCALSYGPNVASFQKVEGTSAVLADQWQLTHCGCRTIACTRVANELNRYVVVA